MLSEEALDEVVRAYEFEVSQTGEEKPFLRVAFAAAFDADARPRERLRQLRAAAELLPHDERLFQDLLEAYEALGDLSGAIAACHARTALRPQDVALWERLGDLYEELGRHDEARLAWATMAEARPREAEGYARWSRKLHARGEVAAAARALRLARRWRPTVFAHAEALAGLYRELDETDRLPALWEDGIGACRQAMRDLPDDPTPWLELGRFLVAADRPTEARAHLEETARRTWPRFNRETRDQARALLDQLR